MARKMIKKVSLVVLAIFLILIFWQISQNNPAAALKYVSKKGPIPPDSRRLIYAVKFLGILPVGKAIIYSPQEVIYKDKAVDYLCAKVSPYPYLAKVFKFKAQIDSFIAKDTGLPVLFRQKIEVEGKKSDNKEVFYDQERRIMSLRQEERVILPNTYEPLSAILYLRKADLNKQKDFDLNLNTNQKNYGMRAVVLSKERLNNRDIFTLGMQIARRDKNNPYHRSKVTLYLLDDPQKTPVLIKVMASGAYIVARLIGYE